MTMDIVSTKTAVLVGLLLVLQTHRTASSFKITRGDHDSVWYGEDYFQMVNRTDLSTMNCSKTDKGCQCKKNDGYNTIIYNNTADSVKCVKDEDEAILGHKIYGEYIQNEEGKCLGVKDKKMVQVPCIKNDLSLLWQRIQLFNIINIKTLKCLQWNSDSQNVTAAQCNVNDTQHWYPKITSLRTMITPYRDATAKPLYSNLSFETQDGSYTGCYRVSEDKMLHVVKEHAGKNMAIAFKALPIFAESTCKIGSSTYSTLGESWDTFPSPPQAPIFSLDAKKPVILKITNRSRLFRQWSGALIKLDIECGTENHCAILKIEGERENEISKITTPSTTSPATPSPTLSVTSSATPPFTSPSTSPATSPSTSSSTSSANSPSTSPSTSSATLSSTSPVTSLPTSTVGSPPTSKITSTPTPSSKKSMSTQPVKKNSKMSSMLYIIPIVVLICLLIIALVIFFCCRRRKRANSGKDLHIYEESTFNNSKGAYEDPSQMTKMKQLNPRPYVSPGTTIAAGRVYDEPTTPTLPNSGQKPPNNNNFQYDYATREETSLLPLILNGDVVLKDDPPKLPKSRPARQSSEKPFYHTLDEGKSGTTDPNAGQPYGNPLYYTLEAEKPDPSHPAANQPDESGKNSQEPPVYNTLENNYEVVDNVKSQ